jgi:hypothetical protein
LINKKEKKKQTERGIFTGLDSPSSVYLSWYFLNFCRVCLSAWSSVRSDAYQLIPIFLSCLHNRIMEVSLWILPKFELFVLLFQSLAVSWLRFLLLLLFYLSNCEMSLITIFLQYSLGISYQHNANFHWLLEYTLRVPLKRIDSPPIRVMLIYQGTTKYRLLVALLHIRGVLDPRRPIRDFSQYIIFLPMSFWLERPQNIF